MNSLTIGLSCAVGEMSLVYLLLGDSRGDLGGGDTYFSSNKAEYFMRRVAAVAVGLCLEIPLPKLDSTMEFSAEELEEAWPRFRDSIYI